MNSSLDENDIFAQGPEEIAESGVTSGQGASGSFDDENVIDDDRAHRPADLSINREGATNSPPDHLADVMDSMKGFQDELAKNRKEIENQRELLELLGADTWSKRRAADEQAFLDNVRETFARDPAQAASIMIGKAQEQMWHAFEKRLNDESRQKSEFERFMNGISSNPEKASMKEFRDEIEFLVRDRGMDPEESVGLIEKISSKLDRSNDRKKAAIRKMRAESQFEASQHASNSSDPDREFTRLMSQAKSLDDMFASLRKVSA